MSRFIDIEELSKNAGLNCHRKYNRVTAQYRLANEQERAVGHRL